LHPHEYQKRKDTPGGGRVGFGPPRSKRTEQIDPRAFGLTKPVYSVAETLDLLHISRAGFYAAVKNGAIRIVKRGKSSLVYADDIAAYLTSLRAA